MRSTTRATVAAAFLLATVSCAHPDHATIWTDRPELAFAVSIYNSIQTRFHVDVEYVEDLGARFRKGGVLPALALGSGLRSPTLEPYFMPLDDVFGEYLLRADRFYDMLLHAGQAKGGQLLLPVAFNLPLVAFVSSDSFRPSEDFVIGVPELREAAADFSVNPKKKGARDTTKTGFSPRFQPDFLLVLAEAEGGNFREWFPVDWNKEAVDRAIGLAVECTDQDNGGLAAEDAFSFRYLAGPPSKWLLDGRVKFAYLGSADFFRLPESRLATLDFRWLTGSAGIPILDDVAWVGLCAKAPGTDIARDFLVWLMRPETQFALLERFREYGTYANMFGFLGGFSALRDVNERGFSRHYPTLIAKSPPAERLLPPASLPAEWRRLKAEVLLPGLAKAAATRPYESATETLRRDLNEWLRVREE
jgi:hypothetical protein